MKIQGQWTHKKYILLSLFAAAVMLIIPCRTIHAAQSTNKQAGKVYAKIIERYMEAQRALQNHYEYSDIEKESDNRMAAGYVNELGDFNLISEFMYEMKEDTLLYRIMDFNKDGTPELFIADPNGKIHAAFTFGKGNAIYLFSSFHLHECVLNKNGIIERHVEGGSQGNIWFDKLLPNKTLKRIMDLWAYQEENPHYMYNKNGTDIEITKKKYKKFSKKYHNPLKLKFYQADAKATKNIKKGKFSYKNQKSWTF